MALRPWPTNQHKPTHGLSSTVWRGHTESAKFSQVDVRNKGRASRCFPWLEPDLPVLSCDYRRPSHPRHRRTRKGSSQFTSGLRKMRNATCVILARFLSRLVVLPSLVCRAVKSSHLYSHTFCTGSRFHAV